MSKASKNIKTAFLLNIFFSVVELVGGLLTNSISIISDSVHDFGDALSIGIAIALEKKSERKPDEKYTFGYSRYSLLGAFITSMILLIGSILIVYNVIPRLLSPTEVNYDGMFWLAVAGVIINGLAAYKTSHGHNLNEKAVSLHMLEDVLGWIAVLAGSVLIKFTGLYIIDPILSLLITGFILFNVVKNIKQIFEVFLEKNSGNIEQKELIEELLKIDMVKDVHHIHVWSVDGENNYLTMHVFIKDTCGKDAEYVKHEIRECLEDHGIVHSTIEIEYEKCSIGECNMKYGSNPEHHHH